MTESIKTVPRTETAANGNTLYTFNLPPRTGKDKDGKPTTTTPVVTVELDTKKINVPTASKGKGQKRLTMADLKAHPEQAYTRWADGSAQLTDKLILALIAPLSVNGSPDHPSCNTSHGQDETRPDGMPVVFVDDVIGRGHRRQKALAYIVANAPELAEALYPKGTMLCDVQSFTHDTVAALGIFDDHSKTDNRQALLFAETIGKVQRLEKTHDRAALIARIGKQTIDDVQRFAAMPADFKVWYMDTAHKLGTDPIIRNAVNALHNEILTATAKAQIAKLRDTATKAAVTGGKTMDEATKEAEKLHPMPTGRALSVFRADMPTTLSALEPETRLKVADLQKVATGAKVANPDDKEKQLGKKEIATLDTYTRAHQRSDDQGAAVRSLLAAINTGKLEHARIAIGHMLRVLPFDTDTIKAAMERNAIAEPVPTKKPASAKKRK